MQSVFSLLLLAVLCSTANAATNEVRPWRDYRTIMWVSDSAYKKPEKVALFFERLRAMGVNTAMVHGDGNLQPLLENRFPYYVENMVNRGLCLKFSSNVRDWNKFVTDWAKGGRPEASLVRDYCFDDPQWRGWARKEMQSLVRKNRGHAPFAYDIRDELSTTISANPFDYDFSPLALTGFRLWLREQYHELAALNAEWETQFKSWDEVKPFTTDQIKNRMASGLALPRGNPDWQAVRQIKFDPASARRNPTSWNFSPWCDFRTFMDLSLARTLGDLRDAAHELDPQTPVGIEGMQMPSAFGGYDLSRLAQVLDWAEPYDIGNAREILGSFMPGRPMMTTVFEKDTNHARRRLWHLLLEGDRGCVVWWSEDCIDWNSADYALTAKGQALAPVLREMQSPLAELFLRAEPERDPIFLLYSQPSIQVDWLLESTVDGSTWLRRFSSYEAEHNRMAQRRNGWLKLFQDLGYTPQFVPADKFSFVFNPKAPHSALVLSEARALSHPQEHAAAMMLDCPPGGTTTLFTDTASGVFNEHGRLLTNDTLLTPYSSNGVVTASRRVPTAGKPTPITRMTKVGDLATFAKTRVKEGGSDWSAWVEKQLDVPRAVTVPAETHTRIHRYKLGSARLLAFERNIDYHMSEDLKQTGGNEALEKSVNLSAALGQPAHIYDLRSGKYLGRTDKITFTLDPWQPSLFALLPNQITGPDVVEALRVAVK